MKRIIFKKINLKKETKEDIILFLICLYSVYAIHFAYISITKEYIFLLYDFIFILSLYLIYQTFCRRFIHNNKIHIK